MTNFLKSARKVASRAIILPLVAVAFAACDDDDPVVPELDTIAELASNTDNLSTLTTALTEADLVSTLQNGGPFTVFAPVNSAFAALPEGELDRLLDPANADELAELLTYHVVPGTFNAADLSEGQMLTTVAGPDVTITLAGGAQVNGVDIVQTDIEASNGVIHLIDGVLLPPRPDIATLAAGEAGLSTLTTALQAAGLDETLAGDGPFTVFAPVNPAFDDLGTDVIANLLQEGNVETLSKVLTFHVVAGTAAFSRDLTDGQTVTTVQGGDLTIGVTGGDVTVNGVSVTTADIRADNGVVHLIDEVLVPELDIVDQAVLNATTGTLTTALAAADLQTTLKGDGPFTVFAPVDAAFAALDAYTLDQLLAEGNEALLTEILTYHVVPGEVLAGDLTDGGTATTVEGRELTFDLSDASDPRVNGVSIITTDIVTSNGVIHLVDEVIVPELDIVETATITEETSTLTTAVAAGGLVETLSSPNGPFTVFAPINAAFEALGTDELGVLLEAENQGLLEKVLTYHVVPGEIRAADLTDGAMVTTVEGTDVTIDLSDPEDPRVNGASIIVTDIETENGVIHLIDGVLTENLDIVDVATVNGFSTLVELVAQQGLAETLRGDNGGDGYTVFAPTNAAFDALASVPSGDALTEVLLYHVVAATVGSGDLTDGQVVTSANTAGDTFTVNIDGTTVTLTDGAGNTVNVVLTDVAAANGVIHVIDAVLLPGS